MGKFYFIPYLSNLHQIFSEINPLCLPDVKRRNVSKTITVQKKIVCFASLLPTMRNENFIQRKRKTGNRHNIKRKYAVFFFFSSNIWNRLPFCAVYSLKPLQRSYRKKKGLNQYSYALNRRPSNIFGKSEGLRKLLNFICYRYRKLKNK